MTVAEKFKWAFMELNAGKTTIFIVILNFLPLTAHAGFLKWVGDEALPTLTGNRPVEIKPYISVKSGSSTLKFGNDAAMIKVGGVTIQTGKLKRRLAQAGCIYATGDVVTCAPDIIDREARKIFEETSKGTEVGYPDYPPLSDSNQYPDYPPLSDSNQYPDYPPLSDSNRHQLKVDESGMREVPLFLPTGPAVGFDFSNPGSKSSQQSPSAFFHSFAVERKYTDKNRVTINIVGVADFAFMNGKKGGVICLFANENGKYLRDRNDEYRDAYGVVAIGGSSTITNDLTRERIQLSMPWEELHLSDEADPYAPKFVQCRATIDNKPHQDTEWVPF